MDIEKYIKKKHHYDDLKSVNKIKYLKNLIMRILISIIMILLSSILAKINTNNSLLIEKYLFNDSLKFTKINNWYHSKIGNIIPDINNNYVQVFNYDNIFKNKYENYFNGVKITVSKNSPINILNGGLVVFIGDKDNYNKTIIIQGNDGIDYWYGGIINSNVNLYDYLEKDSLIGEAENDYIFLVLEKDGQFLNYESYMEQG